jgi:hypothetical protein
VSCVLINQYSTGLFVSYSSEKPNCTKWVKIKIKCSQCGSALTCYEVASVLTVLTRSGGRWRSRQCSRPPTEASRAFAPCPPKVAFTQAIIQFITGMSELAIWEKMNGTEKDGTVWNEIEQRIGFENAVDYCSWKVNKIHQYHSKWTWTVFTI